MRNSLAPAPPRIGDGISPSTVQPCASIAARTLSAGALKRRFGFDLALDEIGFTDLELRLDQAHQPRPLRGEFKHMRQHEALRNETHVDDNRARPLAKHHARERARVKAFKRAHPWIGREARIELPPADIDGDDRRRAAREQHIGEASGRGADVEADETAKDRARRRRGRPRA